MSHSRAVWRPALRTLTSPHRVPIYSSRLDGTPRPAIIVKWLQSRGLASTRPKAEQAAVPLRKHLKEEAKRKKAATRAVGVRKDSSPQDAPQEDVSQDWELTVGLEIHAELNTAHKLFSEAPAIANHEEGDIAAPNTRVAPFDAALPGAQPRFQTATLLPAIRAALALNCTVQRKSSWDRKHYFHWDQPNGYQITQFYEPFAKDGHLTLSPIADGIPVSDLPPGEDTLTIGIKQVQMEQDTAKTTTSAHQHRIDLNRTGHPLIEVITLPHIHSPRTAAAAVRKIQALLRAVNACVTGMELGGLRADVNVSVLRRRQRPQPDDGESTTATTGGGGDGGTHTYGGVVGLGQRTEIKNLASFKAVEDAIVAERDRQIAVLEAGGVVMGETRGWTLGATATTRLRGKEGEVDYRYMPDPDLPPVFVAEDVVSYLRDTLPELPDRTVERVRDVYGLSLKDARTIVGLDDGERLEFLEETVDALQRRGGTEGGDRMKLGKMVGNWVLHEVGGLLTATSSQWDQMTITPLELAELLASLITKQITARAAKQLLVGLHEASTGNDRPSVDQLINEGNLRLRPLSDTEYKSLAQTIMDENPKMVADVRDRGQRGKVMWFVGQMLRQAEEGTVEPEKAREVIEALFEISE